MLDAPGGARVNDSDAVERPAPTDAPTRLYGSDRVADVLRALGIPYVALNPGASFRGLHDSLVNHLGNERPRMLLCLHEEHAVALAHGWAKVTDRAMAAILHSNVGLMHGTMAIFNAWCDRTPMLVLGATGPVDAARRRPWIDWIHTSRDQGALVRGYTKWDDQPASAPAAVEAVLRAHLIANTPPFGPTYVNLDAGMQEAETPAAPMPDVARYRPPASPAPDGATLAAAASALAAARKPLILCGRVSRSQAGWDGRVRLAERLGAAVLTDMKPAASFPTAHRLHAAPAAMFPGPAAAAALRDADVVLSLDWIDLAGTLSASQATPGTVIQASMDQFVHNGWSMDHQALPPVDHALLCPPEAAVDGLLDALGEGRADAWAPPCPARGEPAAGPLAVPHLAAALRDALAGLPTCLVRSPLSWSGAFWDIAGPLDALGYDGGGGIGSGPGMMVGAALALRGTGRLPVGVLGDGDFLMGCTALWTAARYGIPLLVVVANNRSFYNDEIHQERVAHARNRNPANKWIGQHIGGPDIDLAGMARAQGCTGFGPVHDLEQLRAVLPQAIAALQAGAPVVVDVRVLGGYGAEMTSALTRETKPTVAEAATLAAPAALTVAPMLEVHGVTKRFGAAQGGITAVENVTFDVLPGEFVSIIGPSGCGKSTLFGMIGGLIDGWQGRISIDGAAIRPGAVHRHIGMVFQEESTFPWRTVIENVALPLEGRGMAKSERMDRARHFIGLVGLNGFERRFPHEISGGMRQRTAIARTLAYAPRILMMDEPFGALDEQTRLLLGDTVLRIQQELGQTILLITHSIAESVQLSDRVLVMTYRPGRLKRFINIDLPRPRSSEDVGDPRFGRLVAAIWGDLREEATRGLRDSERAAKGS